ncbi:MAG: hypothetical protein AB7T63_10325 [Planctomycetota bacterium]
MAAKKKSAKKPATKPKSTREERAGKGTKPERKDARREANETGRGPNRPRRSDRAMPGEGKRRQGPRTRG